MAKERQRRALELRKAGATYQAIADQLGYAGSHSARKAVLTAFEDIPREAAGEVRTLQVERLHHMLVRVWADVQAGDFKAMDIALRIMDQLNRLQGVEAPTTTEVNVMHQGAVLVIDGNQDDYIKGLQRMAQNVIDIPPVDQQAIALPPGVPAESNGHNPPKAKQQNGTSEAKSAWKLPQGDEISLPGDEG
jgi:hypothetical protein